MAKDKKKNRKKPQRKLSLLATLGLTAGLAEPLELVMQGQIKNAFSAAVASYTGWSPTQQKFDVQFLKAGLLPAVVGAGASMAVSKLGVNKRLNIPFIKL